jgi:hypothetical protein
MVQVLAHDLLVTHIYIFVRDRSYPLYFHARIKCLIECSGDRNLNEGFAAIKWSLPIPDICNFEHHAA